MDPDQLAHQTLDVDDPAHQSLVRGFQYAVERAFRQGRPSEEVIERRLRHVRADQMSLHGVWASGTDLDSSTIPVATYASWGGAINVGGGRQLPLHLISEVTVAPTHRRQGLMRRLMVEDLAQAVAAGRPLAALTASEGTIYGRFGFGPATRARQVEVDTSIGFVLRPEAPVAGGDLVLLDPTDGDAAADAVETVFAAFHAETRGSVDRPSFYRDFVRDAFDFDAGSPDGKLHLCVHTDTEGRPDGYVLFKYDGEKDGHAIVRCRGLVATSPAVSLRLWRFLADLDLSDRVLVRGFAHDDPLPWALVDSRLVRLTADADMLWLRVLDVPAALQARPWGADGAVVLDIVDPLGHAAGRWRVTVSDGQAQVASTRDEPDLALDVETLGSLYLGGVGTTTLAAAGRLAGDAALVATWATMADTGPPPYCITGF